MKNMKPFFANVQFGNVLRGRIGSVRVYPVHSAKAKGAFASVPCQWRVGVCTSERGASPPAKRPSDWCVVIRRRWLCRRPSNASDRYNSLSIHAKFPDLHDRLWYSYGGGISTWASPLCKSAVSVKREGSQITFWDSPALSRWLLSCCDYDRVFCGCSMELSSFSTTAAFFLPSPISFRTSKRFSFCNSCRPSFTLLRFSIGWRTRPKRRSTPVLSQAHTVWPTSMSSESRWREVPYCESANTWRPRFAGQLRSCRISPPHCSIPYTIISCSSWHPTWFPTFWSICKIRYPFFRSVNNSAVTFPWKTSTSRRSFAVTSVRLRLLTYSLIRSFPSSISVILISSITPKQCILFRSSRAGTDWSRTSITSLTNLS